MSLSLGVATLIGSGISAIGSLFGAARQNSANLQSVRESNKGLMDLARMKYAQDTDFWERQNVYNSPVEQMKRLEAAGLNPNLLYGNGSVSVGNSSSFPEAPMPSIQRYQQVNDGGFSAAGRFLNEGLSQYALLEKQKAEIDNIHQDTRNKQQDESLKRLHQIAMGISNSKSQAELDNYQTLFDAEIANYNSNVNKNDAQAGFTRWQGFRDMMLFPVVQETAKADLESKLLHNKEYNWLIKMQPYRQQEIISKISEAYSRIALNYANTRLSNTSSDVNIARHGFILSQELSQDLENEITRILIDTGVNIRGSEMERAVNSIVSDLGGSETTGQVARVVGNILKFAGGFIK